MYTDTTASGNEPAAVDPSSESTTFMKKMWLSWDRAQVDGREKTVIDLGVKAYAVMIAFLCFALVMFGFILAIILIVGGGLWLWYQMPREHAEHVAKSAGCFESAIREL